MQTRIASLPLVLYLVVLSSPGIVVAGGILEGPYGQRPIPLLAEAPADACVEQCGAVRKQCKLLCGETGARAAVQTGEVPYKAEGTCLKNCDEDYVICKESC
jgi:hypothetical protein